MVFYEFVKLIFIIIPTKRANINKGLKYLRALSRLYGELDEDFRTYCQTKILSTEILYFTDNQEIIV